MAEVLAATEGESEGITVATENEGDRGCGLSIQGVFEGGCVNIPSEHLIFELAMIRTLCHIGLASGGCVQVQDERDRLHM